MVEETGTQLQVIPSLCTTQGQNMHNSEVTHQCKSRYKSSQTEQCEQKTVHTL